MSVGGELTGNHRDLPLNSITESTFHEMIYCERKYKKFFTQPRHPLCEFEKELEASIFKRTRTGIEVLEARLLEPSVQHINTSHAIVRGLGYSSPACLQSAGSGCLCSFHGNF